MIVDQLRSRELGDRVGRAARLRWDGGEFDLRLELPAALAGPPEDGSPYLAATLQLAMRLGEDLVVDAPVSAQLLRRCAEIQQVYSSWDPRLPGCEIQVSHEVRQVSRGGAAVSFFSRGVDSMYSAVCEREEPLSGLLFCDGLDTLHDERVRAEEMRLASDAAAAIGLPLTVVSTNLRTLVDQFGIDWEDYVAPGLVSVAHALSGGLRRAVIPSTDTYATLEPCGTGPLLDPLFSTEAVRIEHDSIAPSRAAKIAWLSARRPDLLRWLKVCFFVNDHGNCGACGKCLLTMLELDVAGTLLLAELFP